MQATLEQLQQISLLAGLQEADLQPLLTATRVQQFLTGEMVMQEGDRLPPRLFAVAAGSLRVARTANTGKETIFRLLSSGEMFAAPALFGNGIAPATVTAEEASQVVMVEREALMESIRHNPEIAFKMLGIFNQRLQRLHDTVHGLVSERAIARLIRYLQYHANTYGTDPTADGDLLRSPLSYYAIARSIGITYEECVRLFRQLRPAVQYRRGGKIVVKDWQQLNQGAEEG